MLERGNASQNISEENFSDGTAEVHTLIIQKLARMKC